MSAKHATHDSTSTDEMAAFEFDDPVNELLVDRRVFLESFDVAPGREAVQWQSDVGSHSDSVRALVVTNFLVDGVDLDDSKLAAKS